MIKNHGLLRCFTAKGMIIIYDYIVRLIKIVESLSFARKLLDKKPIGNVLSVKIK